MPTFIFSFCCTRRELLKHLYLLRTNTGNMKIIVTGADGQLGSEIRQLTERYPSHQFLFTDVAQLDVTRFSGLSSFLENENPDVVINCAAYTQVDKAETEQELASALNIAAVEDLSVLSEALSFYLIHISTDYVFDGKSALPIDEEQEMAPESFYGLSKAAGEAQMRLKCKHGAIVRTSWLYSSFGHNFVKTIIKHGRERGALKVVDDQIGTPTYAFDLAAFLLSHLEKMMAVAGVETYHFSNAGIASWYDFAHAILKGKNIPAALEPVPSSEYPAPAPRPAYSLMSKLKIKERFNYIPRHWEDALDECLAKIDSSGQE